MSNHAFLNGEVVKSALADYSISDTVTPLIPGNSPGVPAFDFTVPDKHPNPMRFIRRRGALREQVPIIGTVTGINFEKASKLASYTFESDLQQLNRFMRTYRLQGDNSIFNMIRYTLLASLPPDIDFEIDAEMYVKHLQAYFPDVYDNGLDSISNVLAVNRMEMHTSYDFGVGIDPSLNIELREAFQTDLYINQPAGLSISTDDTNRSSKIRVTNYDYYFANNEIVWKSDSVVQIAANEFHEMRVSMQATPQSVVQPVCVSTMLPPVGDYDPPSKYVITGNDGYIVSPQFWADNGGSVEVSLDNENPTDLIIRIRGCNNLARSPYRISEGEADRPALAISGTGVVENPSEMEFDTGDFYAPNAEQSLDTTVVGTVDQAHNMASGLIHEYGMPKQSISVTLPNDKKHYRMVKRPYKRWHTGGLQTLPQQIQSAGEKLESAEGFYSPNKYYYDSVHKGIVVSVRPSEGINNNPVLIGDPALAHHDNNTRYSLASRVLPWKRAAIRRLWILPNLPGSQYVLGVLARRATTGDPVRVRLGIQRYDANFRPTTLAVTNRQITNTRTLHTALIPSSPDNVYMGVGIYTDGLNTVYDDIIVEGFTLRTGSAALHPDAGVTTIPQQEVTDAFSNMPGAMLKYNDCMYRVSESTYTSDAIQIEAQEHTTLGDLDKLWAGKLVSEFDAVHGSKSFLEFAQEPLKIS